MTSLKLDKKQKELYLILSLEVLKDYHRLVVSDLGENPKPEKFEQAKFVSFLLYLMERKDA